MPYNCKTPEDVLRAIKNDKIEMIDLRFTDLPGLWQHFSVPPDALDHDSFTGGIGFDGSSIRGFQEIQESDMLVVPDPATAFLDPFTEAPTLVLICTILDPVSAQPYSRDPRYIAQKAETLTVTHIFLLWAKDLISLADLAALRGRARERICSMKRVIGPRPSSGRLTLGMQDAPTVS